MKEVEFFRWRITDPHRHNAKPHLSAWKMTAEDAARYPGAVPDLNTREVRQVPETEAEGWETRSRNATTPPRMLK